jgi:hypothetical protein
MAANVSLQRLSVQLYAAGTTGNGSTPTQLFSTPFITAADGSFSVSESYICPTANSILYAVAR